MGLINTMLAQGKLERGERGQNCWMVVRRTSLLYLCMRWLYLCRRAGTTVSGIVCWAGPDFFPPITEDQKRRGAMARGARRLCAGICAQKRDDGQRSIAGSDACVATVCVFSEARSTHPHMAARKTFFGAGWPPQAAPAPRFKQDGNAMPCGNPVQSAVKLKRCLEG